MKTQQGIPLIGPVLNAVFGSQNERRVKKYTQRVDAINALSEQTARLTDAQLREKTAELRERVKNGAAASDILVEAFAVAREAMDRAVGIRNVFNPRFADAFDASKLPAEARRLYDETKAKMDACEPADPIGDFLGNEQPQPGWLQLDIPNEVYDAVREMYPESRPPFRARPFDVQLIGAMVLSQGKISEMKTGEGKTIVAPLACYLASLEGLKCHVVTVNDYLVQRDRDWVYPFFRALGLTVGAIHPQHMQPEPVKRAMYLCDVVYGTTAEFGFDYLRDNMKRAVEQQVQRVRQYAIVDEVDSILIDEARTPLIISGPAHEDAPRYDMADKLALHLVEKNKPWTIADEKVQTCLKRIKGLEGDIRNARDKSKVAAMQESLKQARAELPTLEAARDGHTQYYETELDKKQAHVTHEGIEEAQRVSGLGSFYVGENIDVPHLLEQAIRAHVVYERDRDYIVMPTDNPQTGRQEPSIVIVDTFTGRPMIGRQWSDGLHQAVEAKEGVPIKQETQTVATVTIQNFFKMYERLAGMTGTADTEAQEFHDIYGLDVVVIPTNKPVIRADFNDTIFLTGKDKWDAIVDEIKSFHDVGRPVLVGTTSVEKSEMLAQMLQKQHQIKHEVLNAKQHEREANIIENAGNLGAVMIATNMAGRGTDIKLPRLSREQLLEHWQRRGLAPRELTVEASDDEVREKVFRKIAPRELGVQKKDVEAMSFEEVELALLRKWASEHTWIDPKKTEKMDAQSLRDEIDSQGRFLLHRIKWVNTIEELGGLHVIGTERHESRRIDNQLRGRSGRQGDKGSSRFFVSFDDDLMKLFAGETTLKILSRLGMKEGDSIEHPMMTRNVERVQRKVEERNFHIRKNILEYDEIMEHQRQEFYGLRQQVLEGRDIKGVIFNYIVDSAGDAAHRFLDGGYAAECIAEYAGEQLSVTIDPMRLRNKDRDDVLQHVRDDARQDMREMISVTMGEYMPPDGSPEELDVDNFARWIRTHLGLDLKPSDLRAMSRAEVAEALEKAAEERIASAELDGIDRLLDKNLGAENLRKWVADRFGIELTLEEITEPESIEDVIDMIAQRASDKYREREINQPVSFALDMTMMLMQRAPEQAMGQLINWARTRLGLEWDEQQVRTTPPQKIREQLVEAMRSKVENEDLETDIEAALACPNNDALDEHLKENFGAGLPDWMRALRGERRENAIRGRVESLVRAEMVQFERFVLLEVLDPAWKDHLYAMDQLRDTINFRAFSQRDPKIEYKREGTQLFEQMHENIRDRASEYVFKMRMAPQLPPMPRQQPMRAQGQPAMAGAGVGAPAPAQQAGAAPTPPRPTGPAPGVTMGSSFISGPGLGAGSASPVSQTTAPAPPSAPEQPSAPTPPPAPREMSEVRRVDKLAGGAPVPKQTPVGATPPEKPKTAGRNDPCPCGSGKKYKKCCGAPGGASDTDD